MCCFIDIVDFGSNVTLYYLNVHMTEEKKKRSWLSKINPIVAMRPYFGWDPHKKEPVWIWLGMGFLIGILIGLIILMIVICSAF